MKSRSLVTLCYKSSSRLWVALENDPWWWHMVCHLSCLYECRHIMQHHTIVAKYMDSQTKHQQPHIISNMKSLLLVFIYIQFKEVDNSIILDKSISWNFMVALLEMYVYKSTKQNKQKSGNTQYLFYFILFLKSKYWVQFMHELMGCTCTEVHLWPLDPPCIS